MKSFIYFPKAFSFLYGFFFLSQNKDHRKCGKNIHKNTGIEILFVQVVNNFKKAENLQCVCVYHHITFSITNRTKTVVWQPRLGRGSRGPPQKKTYLSSVSQLDSEPLSIFLFLGNLNHCYANLFVLAQRLHFLNNETDETETPVKSRERVAHRTILVLHV